MTTPSTNGELAESASSSGQKVAQRVADRIARSAPRTPTWTWRPKRVVPPDDVAEDLVVAPVVRRVDDSLVLPELHGCVPVAPSAIAERSRELVQLRAALGRSPRRPRRSSRSGPCAPRPRRRSARRRGALRAACPAGCLRLLEAVRRARASRDRGARTPPRPPAVKSVPSRTAPARRRAAPPGSGAACPPAAN